MGELTENDWAADAAAGTAHSSAVAHNTIKNPRARPITVEEGNGRRRPVRRFPRGDFYGSL